jgi:hypothetical protein
MLTQAHIVDEIFIQAANDNHHAVVAVCESRFCDIIFEVRALKPIGFGAASVQRLYCKPPACHST